MFDFSFVASFAFIDKGSRNRCQTLQTSYTSWLTLKTPVLETVFCVCDFAFFLYFFNRFLFYIPMNNDAIELSTHGFSLRRVHKCAKITFVAFDIEKRKSHLIHFSSFVPIFFFVIFQFSSPYGFIRFRISPLSYHFRFIFPIVAILSNDYTKELLFKL